MAKQTTEEELNLKRQTRRRLIGAAALVVVVVILLPIVFDSEPAPSKGSDIELRIPNKDNTTEFQPNTNSPESGVMASEVAAASAVVPAAVSAPVVAPAPVAEKKPVAAAPVSNKPKVESKPAAKTPAVPKSGWVLQVGAFSHADAAKSLLAKLSKQGFHAYTEKSGNMVRVRMGSYPTREAAEKMQKKLQAQGTPSNVLSLE
jgi:DedD protein